MNTNYLSTLSAEERAKINEKSRLKREELRRIGERLKNDFEDENHWRNLASRYGIRMPQSYQPNTETKYLKRVAKKLGIDLKEYLDACGAASLKELVGFNPDWPAYAEVGLLLEYWDEEEKL